MIARIEADLKAALIGRDQLKVNVLKSLKNSLKNEEIDKRRELEDEEVLAVLKREAKQRDEAAELYLKGGSNERAQQEQAERTIINEYLPAPMDEAALVQLVEKVSAEFDNDPAKTGQIIGRVLAEAQGQADGQIVAKLVKQRLA